GGRERGVIARLVSRQGAVAPALSEGGGPGTRRDDHLVGQQLAIARKVQPNASARLNHGVSHFCFDQQSAPTEYPVPDAVNKVPRIIHLRPLGRVHSTLYEWPQCRLHLSCLSSGQFGGDDTARALAFPLRGIAPIASVTFVNG